MNEQKKENEKIPTFCIEERTILRSPKNGGNGLGICEETAFALSANEYPHGVSSKYGVRRLTPVECERLQGFPDNYTKIPYRGKPAENCPDTPRYKAIGNSWTVPVVRWIGARIDKHLKGEL